MVLPVRQTWERGIPKMRDPSDLAQTEDTQATTDNRNNTTEERGTTHDDDNALKMVGTWMLCRNGWSLWECYQGCHMDALREWMEFVGTLSWLPHGCSVGMDRVCGNVIMVATWMLCGNGWSLIWTLSWLGQRCSAGMDGVEGTLSWLPHGCSAGMDRVCGNVIMIATWMLCGKG